MKACILSAAESGRVLIDELVSQKKTSKDKLKSYLEANLIWVMKRPDEAAMLTSMSYFALSSESVHELMKMVYIQSVQRLTERLEAGNQERCWKVQKPKVVARAIHNLLLAEIIKGIHSPREATLEQRVHFLWKFVSAWLPKAD